MPRTKAAKRKPKMSKRALALLNGLKAVLAHAQGRPLKGTRIVSFYLRKGKWVRRTKVIN